MTIHQAKGLEFPIVVLAAMANNMYDPSPAIGVASPDRYEFSLGKGLHSVRYDEWCELDRKPRSLAERVRLHYVACTRARDHLIVSICGEHGSNKQPHSSLLWDSIERDPSDVTALDDSPVIVAAAQPGPVAPLPADWNQHVERVRKASRVAFIAAPSGEAAAYLGLQIPPATSTHGCAHGPHRDGGDNRCRRHSCRTGWSSPGSRRPRRPRRPRAHRRRRHRRRHRDRLPPGRRGRRAAFRRRRPSASESGLPSPPT